MSKLEQVTVPQVDKFYVVNGSIYYILSVNEAICGGVVVGKILGSIKKFDELNIDDFKLAWVRRCNIWYEIKDFPDAGRFFAKMYKIGAEYRAACYEALKFRADKIRIVRLGSEQKPATEDEIELVLNHIKKYKKPPNSYSMLVDDYEIELNPKPGFLLISIGSDNRPATEEDNSVIMKQIGEKIDNNDEMTIVTHCNFKAKWVPVCGYDGFPLIVTSDHNLIQE